MMLHAREDYNPRIQDSEGKIPADEPVFLLRAQDKVAATLVRIWALLHREAGGDEDIAVMAENWAEYMDRWPKKKSADL